MKYRPCGKLNLQLSALGFGCMRLPLNSDSSSDINEENAIAMIRYAIENGVNYFDTAWPYHGGNSETLLGKALEDGYREKVYIATKMPTWQIKSLEDCDHFFDEQLKKLQTTCIDFYLLHALNKSRWTGLKELDVFSWAEKKKKEGKIKYFGFSFHDDLPVFKDIIDAYNWDFCQIQYNFMDINEQAGTEGLQYAHAKDIAVIIMEPLRGGDIVKEVPPQIQEIWDKTTVNYSPVEWALHWLWNQPEVSTVLSGMNNIMQVIENINYAHDSKVNSLDPQDLKVIDDVREKYKELKPISCTNCGYCQPCPNKVAVPNLFNLYNEIAIYGNYEKSKFLYTFVPEESRPSSCDACGKCIDICPQKINIPNLIDKVRRVFEMGEKI